MLELDYPDAQALAAGVADLAAAALRARVRATGRAVLACSGGRTPPSYLRRLAALDVPWDRVTVTLTDDRHVPADHPDSNWGMVRRELLDRVGGPGPAGVPLVVGATPLSETVRSAAAALERAGIDAPDVTLLGMGEDGHVASVFPGLELEHRAGPLAGSRGAPGVSERITWSIPALQRSALIVLPLVGEAKRSLFRSDAPVQRPVDLIRAGCCGSFVASFAPAPSPPPADP